MEATSHDERKLSPILALGALAALLSALGALADVAIAAAAGSRIAGLAPEAAARLALLAEEPATGLYSLDFLNLLTTLVTLPAVYACRLALGRDNHAAGLALVLALLGAAVFVSGNAALPMLGLSRGYAAADEAGRRALAAAGEALLARGAHGSPGALPGFLISSLSGLVLSAAMLGRGIFSRSTAVLGLAGNLLLVAYLLAVTFAPGPGGAALALAAPGGLAAIAWLLLVAARLLRLSRVPL